MSLSKKLVRIMQTIEQPAQSARHAYQKFDYSTRDDIFEVLRVALVRNEVAISSTLDLISQTEAAPTARGIAQTRCTVRLNVTLIDSDTDEQRESHWYGEAITAEDKGLQGAATQAMRFWAIQQFQLMDGRESELHNASGVAVAQPATSEAVASAVDDFVALLDGKGLSEAERSAFADYVCTQEKKGSLKAINDKKLAAWARKLEPVDADEIRKRITVKVEK